MPQQRLRIPLAPLRGANARRSSDDALGGTFLRGGFNVEIRDGEWWTRMGETVFVPRIGTTPWWWIIDINADMTVICNHYYALQLRTDQTVTEIYAPAVTENLSVTNGSKIATSTTNRVDGQMVLFGVGPTASVYRVFSHSGNNLTLDRQYEGVTNAAISCRYLDPLARNLAGVTTAYSGTTFNLIVGSAVVFEQLVTHLANALYAGAPALTSGNVHLVITSNWGVPVAIDLSAALAGSPVAVCRQFFFNTALAAPTIIGSDTVSDGLRPRGVYADVYKGRLFLGAAADPNGKFGSRTLYYSQIGDLGQWHTGVSGQTATPNFITFGGEGNAIRDLKTLGDVLVAHRDDTQETLSATGSLSQPFLPITNSQGIGLRDFTPSNRVVKMNNQHFIWTRKGPAIFDGRQLTMVALEAYDALISFTMAGGTGMIGLMMHDTVRQRIYSFPSTIAQAQGGQVRNPYPQAAVWTTASGAVYVNYTMCFVFDYGSGDSWFEWRPQALGAGMASVNVASLVGSTPMLSRPDGTIVAMVAYTQDSSDCDVTAPETPAQNVPVGCRAETPWLSFGNYTWKQLTVVETVQRSLEAGEGLLDTITGGPSGQLWLRMRVYGDMNRTQPLSDVGSVYDSASSQLGQAVDYTQAPTFLQTFTPNAGGRSLKLIFSTERTSAAAAAGYLMAPIRLSDIIVEFTQKESTVPMTQLTGASISA